MPESNEEAETAVPPVPENGTKVESSSERAVTVPESLRHEDLGVVWQAARNQLERFGIDRRGSVSMPVLSDAAALRLTSLLGMTLTSRLDLARLETALKAQGVGVDLDQALKELGVPASVRRREVRASAARRQAARESLEAQVQAWPESWGREWVDWLFQSGQMVDQNVVTATLLVDTVRQILDRWQLCEGESMARNDMAVSLCGSAHALDDGLLLERCVRRALWHALDKQVDYRDGRAVWIAATIMTDQVSAPVLTWQLPLDAQSALGRICVAATAAQVPIHLSAYALSSQEIRFQAQAPVLLVENPRIVEAAAERKIQRCVISTNGNPSTAVMKLVRAMLAAGIEVRHHNDFDVAGVGICRRLAEQGGTPWRMGSRDYEEAVRNASNAGLELPVEKAICGATPWDPQLQILINKVKSVVHEELLLDSLLGNTHGDQ